MSYNYILISALRNDYNWATTTMYYNLITKETNKLGTLRNAYCSWKKKYSYRYFNCYYPIVSEEISITEEEFSITEDEDLQTECLKDF